MRSVLLLALTSATALAAQESDPALAPDWRLPFRNPQANLVAPDWFHEHIKPMWEMARSAKAEQLSMVDGNEVVDDPLWRSHLDALVAEHSRDLPGWLSLIIRDSRSTADRSAAFYASFLDPDLRTGFQMIEHIPGEPVREIREDAYRRAAPFIRARFGHRNPGDLAEWQAIRVGPAGVKPPRPGEFAFRLDPVPFLALLDLDDPVDPAQALWFFTQCADVRPDFSLEGLDLGRARLRELCDHDDERVRRNLRDFLAVVDTDQDRAPPEGAEPDELAAYLDAVIYTVFPPIRRVSSGRVDLYPSDDRDRILAVGLGGLRGDVLGRTAHGKRVDGSNWRGFAITAVPEPLEKLGLVVGDAIVSVNGVPVATSSQLLSAIETAVKTRNLLVEYVDTGSNGLAIEYRIR